MKDVQYFAPETLNEALKILGKYEKGVSVLAGGTDLVRNMNLEFKIPPNVLWIGQLGLDYVRSKEGLIHIGGATRMQTAGASKILEQKATALWQAASKLASPPVRSLATIGGNLCNASPAADTAIALLALGAEVVLVSRRGRRTVALARFFLGPGKTVRRPDELLLEILVKPTGKGEGSAYAKVGRRQALTLAVLNAAARVKVDAKGKCVSATIAVGAAAPIPVHALKAEAALVGLPFTEDNILKAAEMAVTETKPIDDVHGTAWYRRRLTRVLVARCLRQAGGLPEKAE